MEPLFTNEFELNEIVMKEFFKKSYKKLRWSFVRFFIVFFIFAAFQIVFTIMENTFRAGVLILLIPVAVFGYFGFFFVNKLAKMQYKHLLKMNGLIVLVTAKFHNDYIEYSTQTSTAKYPYDKFGFVLKMKNTYGLIFGKNKHGHQGIIIKKDSFTGIDEAGFLSFIHSKCPNLK